MGLPWKNFQILIFRTVIAHSFSFFPLLCYYALLLQQLEVRTLWE